MHPPRTRLVLAIGFTLGPWLQSTLADTCVPEPSGLVAWWRAENNALDSMGINAGELQNGAAFAPGRVALAFSAGMCFQAQNLVQNGSFENGVNPPVSSYLSLFAGDISIDGWVVSAGRIDWSGTPWFPKDGQLSAQLVGDGSSISQAFDTVIGHSYNICLSLQPSLPVTTPVTVDVSLGGACRCNLR